MQNEFFRNIISQLEDIDLGEADHTDEIDFSSAKTFRDAIDLVRKNELNRIGIGKYREAWHHPFDKRLVIKVATPRDETNSQEECQLRNMWEFIIWHECLEKKLPELEFLMPCKAIAPDGSWLTQQKGTRVPQDKSVAIKDQMDWVGDRSKTNYAMLGDQVKSIDYATTKAMEHLELSQDPKVCEQRVLELLKKLKHNYQSDTYGQSQRHPGDDNPKSD